MIVRALEILRWRIRWVRWWLSSAYPIGAPWLGEGDTRAANRKILLDRYWASEPKRPEGK